MTSSSDRSDNATPPGIRKEPREAAMVFIFITLLIDILGIGIVMAITPLVAEVSR